MTSHINYLVLSDLTAAARATLLRRTESDLAPFLEKVKPIIEAVRVDGDTALSRFASQFDLAPVAANEIAATPLDFDRAHAERTHFVLSLQGRRFLLRRSRWR